DALLIAVALGGVEVLDHREAHRLRRPEAEESRIADIKRDHLVALTFELLGTASQLPPDLVTNAFEMGTGFERTDRHGRSSGWKRRVFCLESTTAESGRVSRSSSEVRRREERWNPLCQGGLDAGRPSKAPRLRNEPRRVGARESARGRARRSRQSLTGRGRRGPLAERSADRRGRMTRRPSPPSEKRSELLKDRLGGAHAERPGRLDVELLHDPVLDDHREALAALPHAE